MQCDNTRQHVTRANVHANTLHALNITLSVTIGNIKFYF